MKRRDLYLNSAKSWCFRRLHNSRHATSSPQQDTGTSTLVCIRQEDISPQMPDAEKEIRRWIGIAKSAFTSMSKSVDIIGCTYDSSHQSAAMLCVVNTAIWM